MPLWVCCTGQNLGLWVTWVASVSECKEESTLAGGTSKGRTRAHQKNYCQGDGSRHEGLGGILCRLVCTIAHHVGSPCAVHSATRKRRPCPSNAGRCFRPLLVIYRCLDSGGGGGLTTPPHSPHAQTHGGPTQPPPCFVGWDSHRHKLGFGWVHDSVQGPRAFAAAQDGAFLPGDIRPTSRAQRCASCCGRASSGAGRTWPPDPDVDR